MALTRSNTPSGAVTTFGALGIGNWFDSDSRGLCMKLGGNSLKRDSDGAVESGINDNEEATKVEDADVSLTFAAGATFGGLGLGAYFISFTRGHCIKLDALDLKRLSDGAVETGVDQNEEVLPKGEPSGSYNP